MKITQNRASNSKPLRKATILIIGPTPPPYMGPSVATKMILESELNEDFHIVHMDTSDRRSVANIGRIDFTNVYLVFVHIFKLFILLCRNSPSIVYLPISQTVLGYLRDTVFIILAKFFGVKVIVHLRGGYFRKLYDVSNIFVKFVIRASCKMVSRAIVLDNSLRYIFEGLIKSKQIVVVSNGIDEDYIPATLFTEALNDKYYDIENKKSRKRKILFLSNLILTKGYFEVIKSIPEVIREFKNTEFIFAGDFFEGDKTKTAVYQYIKQHNLESFIKFIGTTANEDKRNLLLTSEIFVFPTYYHAEGQPWVLIEAMAAGLPIISTDQGSIKAMVLDKENGYIVEKKNPSQIAERIRFLLNNTDISKIMGQKNRERFLRNYTKDIFMGHLITTFNDVIRASYHKARETVTVCKPTIVITGPIPPPHHGVTIITKQILDSRVVNAYNVIHHDTSDHRSIKNIGKIDIQNCWLALKHIINLYSILYHNHIAFVYLPICQTLIGVIRDGVFMFLAKMKKAAVIIHLHGGYFRELYKKSMYIGKYIIKRVCSFVEHAIVIGDSFRYIFRGLIADYKITVVSNAIEQNYITDNEVVSANDLRLSHASRKEAVTILYLSNLLLSKGYFDVIKAIPEIVSSNKNVKFIFAGEFDSRWNKKTVEQYINAQNIGIYIDFVGTIIGKKKKETLLSSDIYILPTYYPGEGQPVSILEAMAAGMPIISTNHGCIGEMIVNGVNGYLVKKRDPANIARMIHLLLNNTGLRIAMGKKNRKLFLRQYTVKKLVDALLGVFNKTSRCTTYNNVIQNV